MIEYILFKQNSYIFVKEELLFYCAGLFGSGDLFGSTSFCAANSSVNVGYFYNKIIKYHL